MSESDYWIGAGFFALTFGAAIAAAVLVARARMPELRGSVRVLAVATLATAALLAAHLIPGALTVVSRETAAATSLLLLAGAWLLPRLPPAEEDAYPRPARRGRAIDRALAIFALTACAIWLLLVAARQLYIEPVGFDALSAYLPTAAVWSQTGSIWSLTDWVPGFFFGASPGNGSTILLAALLPWENDFVARYAIYPFVPLTGLAIYGIARELSAPWPAAALTGTMLTAAPVLVQPALVNALLDPVLYAGFATGLLFLLRHHRTGRVGDLAIAGIALGIAFGTKFYGFTAVPTVLAVWAVARLLADVPPRAVLRQLAVVTGLVLAFGGIWVLRNLIATGNPAFPVNVELLGLTIFDAPEDPLREQLGATLFDYLDQPGIWTGELARQFRLAAGLPLLVVAGCLLLATVMLLRRRLRGAAGAFDAPAAVAIVLAVLLALGYALTPYSALGPPGDPELAAANFRYGLPLVIAAAGAVGWVAGRIGRSGMIGFELVALLATLDALRVGVTTPTRVVYGAFALAVLVLGAAWLMRVTAARLPPGLSLRVPGRRALLAGAAAVGIVVIVLGARWQETYNSQRYVDHDPALAWVTEMTRDGARVALSGYWTDQGVPPIYPAFGARLRNRVDYIGPDEDGLLGAYKSRNRFLAAIRRGDYDILVLGRAAPYAEEPRVSTPAGGETREERWVRSTAFEQAASSDRFIVLARRD